MNYTRMVPGAHVICTRCGCIGVLQFVNLKNGSGVVRLTASGELVTLERSEMRLATWEEVRNADQGNSSTGCRKTTSTTQPESLNGR
jgi:hypothetical protein